MALPRSDALFSNIWMDHAGSLISPAALENETQSTSEAGSNIRLIDASVFFIMCRRKFLLLFLVVRPFCPAPFLVDDLREELVQLAEKTEPGDENAKCANCSSGDETTGEFRTTYDQEEYQ